MKVLFINKSTFQTQAYNDVTNIAYNAGTGMYVLTYGGGQTIQVGASLYYMSILWG